MTNKDVNNILKKLLDEIDVLRTQARNRGLAFSSPTTEQLEKKLKSGNTPIIISMAWSPSGSIFNTFIFEVYVTNPDPNPYDDLFAYFFFGPANMISDVGTALVSVDERFSAMYAKFPFMPPGSNGLVRFNYKLPIGTTPGIYLGNTFIFLLDRFDVGAYATRGCMPIEIT